MAEKHLYTLLRVISKNGDIKNLIREGLSFSRIAELTTIAISDGLVMHAKDKIELSKTGIEKLKELEVRHKKINKEEWIEKDKKSIIPKFAKNFIYVPNQNELKFDR